MVDTNVALHLSTQNGQSTLSVKKVLAFGAVYQTDHNGSVNLFASNFAESTKGSGEQQAKEKGLVRRVAGNEAVGEYPETHGITAPYLDYCACQWMRLSRK